MSDESKRLIEWYWRYGVMREGRFKLSSEWLCRLYRLADISPDQRPVYAIWGVDNDQFEAHYSRMLAAGASLFDAGAANVLFDGTSSGQVSIGTRVRSSKRPSDDILVDLMTPTEILLAMAAGYAALGQQHNDRGANWRLRPDDLIQAIDKDTKDRTPDRAATELLIAIVDAVSEVLTFDLTRFANLKIAESWERVVRPAMLRNGSLQADVSAIQRIGYTLLWDDDDRLKKVYASIDGLRSKIDRERDDGTLTISPDAAALLTRDDLVARSGGSRIARRKSSDADGEDHSPKLRDLAIVKTETGARIEISETGRKLLNDPDDVVYLQALVKQFQIDVSGDQIKATYPKLATAMNAADILSLPKLPPVGEDGLNPSASSRNSGTEAVRNLVFYGKALAGLTIAERSNDDLARSYITPTEIAPLNDDVLYSFFRSYDGSVGLAGIDRLLGSHKSVFDETLFSGVGVFPRAVLNATDVHGIIVGDPGFAAMSEAAQDDAADELVQRPGFKTYFQTEDAEAAFFAGFQDTDGGFGSHLLATMKIADRQRVQRGDVPKKTIKPLIDAALPRVDASEQEHRGAFMTLCECISNYCATPETVADRRSAAIRASEMLREAFSLRADDLDPLPTPIGTSHETASNYLEQQMNRWAERSVLAQTFDQLGLSPSDQAIVSRAIQSIVSIDLVAIWLTREFGQVETAREALHCRRYVATKLTQEILGEAGAGRRRLDASSDNLQQMLDNWVQPTNDVESSLHYEVVVAPMINRFADIADRGVSTPWLRQPGDDEIEALSSDLVDRT